MSNLPIDKDMLKDFLRETIEELIGEYMAYTDSWSGHDVHYVVSSEKEDDLFSSPLFDEAFDKARAASRERGETLEVSLVEEAQPEINDRNGARRGTIIWFTEWIFRNGDLIKTKKYLPMPNSALESCDVWMPEERIKELALSWAEKHASPSADT